MDERKIEARGLSAGATEVAPEAEASSPPLASPPIIRGETEWVIGGVPGLFPVGWWRFWKHATR